MEPTPLPDSPVYTCVTPEPVPGYLTQLRNHLPFFATGFCYAVSTELAFRTAQSAVHIFASRSLQSFGNTVVLTGNNLLGAGLFYFCAGKYIPESTLVCRSPLAARLATCAFVASALWYEKSENPLSITKCIRAFRPIAEQCAFFAKDLKDALVECFCKVYTASRLHIPAIFHTTHKVYQTHLQPYVDKITPKTKLGKFAAITLIATAILVPVLNIVKPLTQEEEDQIRKDGPSLFDPKSWQYIAKNLSHRCFG